MKCGDALDIFYEDEDELSLGKRFKLAFHIIFCRHCAAHLENYEGARSLLQNSFFPSSPDFSDSIMNSICHESFNEDAEEHFLGTSGFSVRGWVITGIVLLLSLVAVFFVQDYTGITIEQDSSFLLPMGILTGVVISGYGALFIGSHLKEFSQRFKL